VNPLKGHMAAGLLAVALAAAACGGSSGAASGVNHRKSPPAASNSASSLQISTNTYTCSDGSGIECWGTLDGSGLTPHDVWTVIDNQGGQRIAYGDVPASGQVKHQLDLHCEGGILSVGASSGSTTSNATSPCG
jgi:hypothetical protein